MATVASRDLRNHTSEVLRQVSDGNHVTITVHGSPVAELSPVRAARPRFLNRSDLVSVIETAQADPGLANDLEQLAGQTTDDLDAL
jgi:prevent-host-death family protein